MPGLVSEVPSFLEMSQWKNISKRSELFWNVEEITDTNKPMLYLDTKLISFTFHFAYDRFLSVSRLSMHPQTFACRNTLQMEDIKPVTSATYFIKSDCAKGKILYA